MTTRIEYTVFSAEILGDTRHCEGVYDARASAKRYAELLEDELRGRFEACDVRVRVESRCTGRAASTRVYPGEGDEDGAREDSIRGHVDEIAGRLWEDMDRWLVPADREGA